MDNYLFITADGHPFPIIDRLQDEGKNVVVGLVENPPSEESKETDEKRHMLYDGILDIQPAESVMEFAASVPDKDQWFVMLDYGDLWPWSDRLREMGFSKGVFPTEEGYLLEKDRQRGKAFAKENYPGVTVADASEFKQVDEAIEFLENNPDKVFVLKSEGSEAETVVPETDDPDLAHRQVIGALASEKAEYEKGSFTLEEKIKRPIEISPVMVFWNGEALFSLVELENKGLGSGNIGRLTGGCQNLTIYTPLGCRLNEIAFPDVVHRAAKEQPGVGIYDAGLLFDGEKFCFTEFCGHRWGWDGIFSELSMCRDGEQSPFVSRHFDLMAEGKTPISNKFGVAVRLFQTQPDDKLANVYQDGYTMDWKDEVSQDLFLYCIRSEKDGEDKERFLSVGYRKDLGVAVGASDFWEAAVDQAYSACSGFAMTGTYYRPKFDFVSRDYFSSIPNRYRWLIHSGLID